jgi:hypothetical protein
VLRAWVTALISLIALGQHAAGQSFTQTPQTILPTQGNLAKNHMGPLGKPCLTIEGYAKPELVNKNIYQHLIKTRNDCGQTIKVQVCYYKTEHCVLISVPPYEKKETALGIFPALKRFQFEAKEQY